MDLGDLFFGLDAPSGRRSHARTTDESTAELACLLFMPLVELILVLFAGLGERPLLAMAIAPLALATLAYQVSARLLGTGRGLALGLAIKAFLACAVVGGCAMLALMFFGMFSAF